MRSMDIFLLFIGVLDRFSVALLGFFHPRTAEDRPFQARIEYHIKQENASTFCIFAKFFRFYNYSMICSPRRRKYRIFSFTGFPITCASASEYASSCGR